MNLGFIFAISASVVWGLVYSIDQEILEKINPINLLFINSIISIILLLPLIFFTDNGHNVLDVINFNKKNVLIVLGNSVLLALANVLIYYGIKNAGASSASIIEITYPIFVIIFSFIIFKTIPNYLFFIGAAIVMIGITLIIKSANMI